ncbi:MAG: LLM class flavin-dependent oxidoreductase [Nitrososphaerota archaeon]|jgi:phthiodiolone/phenolphthiodiolone dimycocerosates ketoreductase|nr:LLM class flavin-dependent oxidoreductase [Nitrososphaerota archaeon]
MTGYQDVRFGFKVPFYPIDLVLSSAVEVERVGFSSVWTADHMVGISLDRRDCYSAWSILSALSMNTSKVLLGTSVSDPCRFHPATMAQFAMTIEELSSGRFIFGIGAGEAQNTMPYGIECSKPLSKLGEAIEVIRLLLTGNEISFSGRYYTLNKASLKPGLSGRGVPIWLAANSGRTIKLTAKSGDGWIPLGVVFDPESYGSTLKKMLSIKRQFRGEEEKIEPSLFLHVAIADEEKQAQKMAEVAGKLQVLGWLPEAFPELSEGERERLNFSKLVFDDSTSKVLREIIPKLSMEAVLKRTVVGSPSQCLEKIDRYVKAGAKHIIVSFMGGNDRLRESIRFFSSEIIQYYR